MQVGKHNIHINGDPHGFPQRTQSPPSGPRFVTSFPVIALLSCQIKNTISSLVWVWEIKSNCCVYGLIVWSNGTPLGGPCVAGDRCVDLIVFSWSSL